jgi:type IV secretion system protein VirB1
LKELDEFSVSLLDFRVSQPYPPPFGIVTKMASLPIAALLQLALSHAPQVAPETIAAFAQAESRMNPYALYDNTTRVSYAPKTASEASAMAASLMAQGHSIDTGLMQINSANFGLTGINPVTAFDPAQSIRAAGLILTEAYQRCAERGLGANPLRCMASIYNTGNHKRGEANGYVNRIYQAADFLVPAIREAVGDRPAPKTPPAQSPATPPHGCGPPPPTWDGWATSAYRLCVTRSTIHPETRQNDLEQTE